MTERASYKHQQEKIQGVWGKIKYFIWALFYDTRSQLKRNEDFSLSSVKTKMIEKIKLRMWMNLEVFYEQLCLDMKDIDEESINPKTIKKWFVRYSSDKFTYPQGLSPEAIESANQARAKLTPLYKLWELIESQGNNLDEESVAEDDLTSTKELELGM